MLIAEQLLHTHLLIDEIRAQLRQIQREVLPRSRILIDESRAKLNESRRELAASAAR